MSVVNIGNITNQTFLKPIFINHMMFNTKIGNIGLGNKVHVHTCLQ